MKSEEVGKVSIRYFSNGWTGKKEERGTVLGEGHVE